MQTAESTLALLDKTSRSLIEAINWFDQEQLNRVPFEGSWTPGQVGEHILKSASGVSEVIKGMTRPCDRDPGEKMKPVMDMFLNFETKMSSPEFILPSVGPHDKEKLLQAVDDTFKAIALTGATTDLTAICTDWAIPVMGEFTRLEWICFINSHAARHVHQLNKIAARLVTDIYLTV